MEGEVDGGEDDDDHDGNLDGHVRQTSAQRFGFSKWYYDTARSRTRGAFTLALQARTFWRDARNKNECDTLAAILDALEERNIWLAREIAIRRSIGIQQAEDHKGKEADRWHEADIMAFWNRRSWMSDEDSRDLRRDAQRYRSTTSTTLTSSSSRAPRPRSTTRMKRSKKGGGGGGRKKKAPSSADDD